MTKYFTDENGQKWRVQEDSWRKSGGVTIEPIPTPPPTRDEILRHMESKIDAEFLMKAETLKWARIARAIIDACEKLFVRREK